VVTGTVVTGTVVTGKAADVASARRGRPPGTSRRELELIALRLFTEQGFDSTTIEQIAAEAEVSKRTFFRYFSSKASVLWSEFDSEVDTIRAALADVPPAVPMLEAIRRAVVTANHYRVQDVAELRLRMNLIGGVPALQSSTAVSPPTRCTRSPSAGPPWLRAAPPTTAGRPGRTPTSPSTWTPRCPR
jgi:AcrR family transcriptional regulator